MQIKSTLKGVIEAPDGNVTVTFRKERLNESMRKDAEIDAIENMADKNRAWLRRVLESVESLDGLTDETGRVITAEEVRSGDCFEDVITHLVLCYFEARKLKKSEAEQKKELSS